MPTREQLRDLIEAGREKEASDLLPHVDDSAPPQPGQWTAKDQLAHLTAWRLVAAAELDAVRTGGDVPQVAEDDVENAKIYAETHDQPAALILERARSSWNALISAVEACTDEDLEKPHPREPELEAAWQIIPGNTYSHVAQHLAYWSTDLGDEAGAEKAATWAHELLTSTFPDDARRRGAADYNLGCFYAARGDAARAMPYLRSALAVRPDVREFASKDTALDPIRSNPEFAGLLA